MAGLNIPKREQLENGPKLSDLNKARLKAQDRLSDYAGRAAVKGADVAFGEDTGDSLLEDLAYGAVPGGSLYQRAKTGTRPGLLDFADFIPGSGAMKAMLPIAVKPTLDAMKAGKRMGKTSRNLDKAKVVRYHATRPELVDSILNKGLVPRKGTQSYLAGDDFGEGVWLSGTPYNIPVPYPDIQVFKIDLPTDEYYKAQRVYFPNNKSRDGSKPVFRQAGESPIPSREGLAYVELFKNPIAPEHIQPVKLEQRYYNPESEYRQSAIELRETFPVIGELYDAGKYDELDELLRTMSAKARRDALTNAVPSNLDEYDAPYKALRSVGNVMTEWKPGELPKFVSGRRASIGHISNPVMHRNPPTVYAASRDMTGVLGRIRKSWLDD